MNRAVMLAEIDAIATRLSELRRAVESDEEARDPSPWMTASEYADYARVSVGTVRRWIAAGMPATGDGRLLRLQKDEADAWRSSTRFSNAKTRAAG